MAQPQTSTQTREAGGTRHHRSRVLMTTDAVGGVWNVSLDLAAGLRTHGIEVTLAVIGPAPSQAQRQAADDSGVSIVTSPEPYRLEWMPDPWDDVQRSGEWLCALERQLGCDLVHLNGYAHGAFAFRSPRVVVGHSCVLSWWQAVRQAAHDEPLPASWDRYRETVRAGLLAAEHVVAPTRWMRDELRRHYDLAANISVIYNGASSRQFAPGDKDPFVFAAGRIWDEAKNLHALARVSKRLPWSVVVAGPRSVQDGAAGDRAPTTAEGAGADLRGLTFLGPLATEQMSRLYATASIYALPARYEPFGLSVLEAALSGCALVLGDIPSLRELWDGAATFVDPDDQRGLRAALLRLIEAPEARRGAGRRARLRARRYARDTMVSEYARLYGQLLQPVALREMSCAS